MKTMALQDPDLTPEATSPQALFDRLALLEKENKSLQEEISHLYTELRLMRHRQFGRKSEKLGDMPLLPALQSIFDEPGISPQEEAGEEMPDQTAQPQEKKKEVKKPGRKPLPEDLPRENIVHDLSGDQTLCKCCGHPLSKIGEETSEQLDYIPARIRVIKHVRNKYACKACEEGVTLAPLPPQPLPKSMATAGLLAHILVSKYMDHLPLYRQSTMFERLGVDISRSVMSGWVLKCGDLLSPLVDLLKQKIVTSDYARSDETTLQLLSEARTKSGKSYMWVFMTGASTQPAIVYNYDPTRQGRVAEEFFRDFKGYVQSDAYGGYNALAKKEGVTRVGCWAHARRKFFEILTVVRKPGKAEEAVSIIGKLYDIEREAKEKKLPPDKVKELRQEKSKPILDQFKVWLETYVTQVPPKNPLCGAIKYALNNWTELTRYLEDGRLDIDNNACERAIKPFAVGRKNWLFAGNDAGAKAGAVIFSLIETCKANNVEPFTYLQHVLGQIRTTTDLEQLLPYNFKPNM
jgi:transposase